MDKAVVSPRPGSKLRVVVSMQSFWRGPLICDAPRGSMPTWWLVDARSAEDLAMLGHASCKLIEGDVLQDLVACHARSGRKGIRNTGLLRRSQNHAVVVPQPFAGRGRVLALPNADTHRLFHDRDCWLSPVPRSPDTIAFSPLEFRCVDAG